MMMINIAIIATFLILGISLILIANALTKDQSHIYNCMASEISPDFTLEMIKHCRDLQKGMWAKK